MPPVFLGRNSNFLAQNLIRHAVLQRKGICLTENLSVETNGPILFGKDCVPRLIVRKHINFTVLFAQLQDANSLLVSRICNLVTVFTCLIQGTSQYWYNCLPVCLTSRSSATEFLPSEGRISCRVTVFIGLNQFWNGFRCYSLGSHQRILRIYNVCPVNGIK